MNYKELALFSLGQSAYEALESEIIAAYQAKLLAVANFPKPPMPCAAEELSPKTLCYTAKQFELYCASTATAAAAMQSLTDEQIHQYMEQVNNQNPDNKNSGGWSDEEVKQLMRMAVNGQRK